MAPCLNPQIKFVYQDSHHRLRLRNFDYKNYDYPKLSINLNRY